MVVLGQTSSIESFQFRPGKPVKSTSGMHNEVFSDYDAFQQKWEA